MLATINDLTSRMMQKINYWNKKLFSFNITSLFTNVLVEEALAAGKEVTRDRVDQLPLPLSNFLKLVELCVKFNIFNFQDQEF